MHFFVLQKRQLDERIEQVSFRVEEFQQQLSWMHQNVSSTSEKVSIVHSKMEQLKTLFERIDQVEVCLFVCLSLRKLMSLFHDPLFLLLQAFVNTVTRQLDQLEQVVSDAEKELQPSTIRKVFSALPGMVGVH